MGKRVRGDDNELIDIIIYKLSLSVVSFSGWTSHFSSPLQLLSNPFHKHVFHISVCADNVSVLQCVGQCFFSISETQGQRQRNASECELTSTEQCTRAQSDVREAVDDLHDEASQQAIPGNNKKQKNQRAVSTPESESEVPEMMLKPQIPGGWAGTLLWLQMHEQCDIASEG